MKYQKYQMVSQPPSETPEVSEVSKVSSPLGVILDDTDTCAGQGVGGRYHNSRCAYALVLRPEPGNWRTPPVLRLRGLLKAALRAFGFRCTKCRAIPEPDSSPEAPQEQPLAAGPI